jgi:hypothetical protein
MFRDLWFLSLRSQIHGLGNLFKTNTLDFCYNIDKSKYPDNKIFYWKEVKGENYESSIF